MGSEIFFILEFYNPNIGFRDVVGCGIFPSDFKIILPIGKLRCTAEVQGTRHRDFGFGASQFPFHLCFYIVGHRANHFSALNLHFSKVKFMVLSVPIPKLLWYLGKVTYLTWLSHALLILPLIHSNFSSSMKPRVCRAATGVCLSSCQLCEFRPAFDSPPGVPTDVECLFSCLGCHMHLYGRISAVVPSYPGSCVVISGKRSLDALRKLNPHTISRKTLGLGGH